MADDIKQQLGGLFGGLRKKAAQAVADHEAGFARGKIAGRAVEGDNGDLIVEAGHRIDDAVIERAAAAGKLHALAAAAVTAQAQDFREKASEMYGRTQDGQEARSLGSIEDYVEARRYVGRIAGVDVTDVRGNVIVRAGTEIKEETVQRARESGLLGPLIYAAQQAPPPAPAPAPALTPPAPEVAATTQQPYVRPKPLPLVPLPPDSSGEK